MAASGLILAINAGSSSLKITLFHAKDKALTRIAAASVTGFTSPPAKEKYTRGDYKNSRELPKSITSHNDAFQHILDTFLNDKDLKEVNSKDDIAWACHRVVHGGNYTSDQLIDDETFHKIEGLEDLAPLHNASAVAIIRVCFKELPNVKNAACFDSVFHHTMPLAVSAYAISQDIAKRKGLRKYGFHGISYSYILRACSKHLDKLPSDTSLIALHLGSGASACAIQRGKSIDTTMGLTPVSGLPGGSRSGDIDPSLIFHYTSEASKLSPSSTKELHISEAEDILNKQSGWKALTGTADFAEIAKADAPDTHRLALEIFIDRIIGYVGNYFVKLDGEVDALVFAGGIGEKSALLRQKVVERCKSLGFMIDKKVNAEPPDVEVCDVGYKTSQIRTLVCQTDEEYEMAYHTMIDPPGKSNDRPTG